MMLRSLATLAAVGVAAAQCTIPNSAPPGYETLNQTASDGQAGAWKCSNLTKGSVKCPSVLKCAAGFALKTNYTKAVASCPTDNQSLVLTGCEAMACEKPTAAGYNLAALDCDNYTASGKAGDPYSVPCSGINTTAPCASGFKKSGAVSYSCTKAGAEVTLTGCTPNLCLVNSGMRNEYEGIKYFLSAEQRALTTAAFAKFNSSACTAKYMACEKKAGCLASVKSYLAVDGDVEYASGNDLGDEAKALLACNQAVAGVQVSAASVEATLACKWTGPWGKLDWATGVVDYVQKNGTKLTASCPTDGGAMVLAGCAQMDNCTKLDYRKNMIPSTEKPCEEGRMEHKSECEVACEKGYTLKEKKFTDAGKKIKNYPIKPKCNNGVLEFDMDCEQDADFTPLIIIGSTLIVLLPGLAAFKYLREFAAYNRKKSEGCTWGADGTLLDASGQKVVENEEKMVENPIADDAA